METIPVGKDQVLMAYGEGPACEEEALWTLLDSCEP